MAVAVQSCRNADQARAIAIASFYEALACRYFGPERLALWPFWVIINRVWSLAKVVRYRGHLDIVVGHPVTKHDRCEVDSNKCVVGTGRRRQSYLLVLVVNHARDVRRVRAAVTFSREMEGKGRVFGETGEEELQERIHVLARDWASVDGTSVLDVRVSHIDGLVEEDNIGVRVPAVGVLGRAGAVIGDAARTKLKEQTRRRAAARATIKPHDERRSLWRVPRFKEPGKSSCDSVRRNAGRGLG